MEALVSWTSQLLGSAIQGFSPFLLALLGAHKQEAKLAVMKRYYNCQ